MNFRSIISERERVCHSLKALTEQISIYCSKYEDKLKFKTRLKVLMGKLLQ